jgi:hypothetical protein
LKRAIDAIMMRAMNDGATIEAAPAAELAATDPVVDLLPLVDPPLVDLEPEVDLRPEVERRPEVDLLPEVERRPEVELESPPPVVDLLPEVDDDGQSSPTNFQVSHSPPMGPEAVPAAQISDPSQNPQKSSSTHSPQSALSAVHSARVQESKNHSVQLLGFPPGPSLFPEKHS